MTKLRLTLLALACITVSACTLQLNRPAANTETSRTDNANTRTEPKNAELPKIESGTPLPPKNETAGEANCLESKRDGLAVDKKQTFAMDFAPFERSCFVTFHDPEFTNPALGSQFFVYKNGREVFEFPEQFGAGNATCWVDAVAFEDLNGDQLKDVIVVGKCGAKSGAYNENMVYLNNGKEFVTNAEANAETLDFSKVGQIRDFVKKNPKLFIP